MGCSFCNHIKNEKKNEMINDNESNSTYKLKKIHEEIDTEYLNENQSRNNDIFDFFIDLRSNPSKYIEESKQYELDDIIIYANNNKLFENIKMLINNPFFNLFLNSYVNKYPDSKENILFDLENNMQLQNFEKTLYSVKYNSKNPKDFVWYLLKENKDIALNDILYRNSDFVVISSDFLSDQIIVYFLFLKRN